MRDVYDVIAESWSKLKTKPFPFVLDFVKDRKGLFLVEGCGAGRHSSLIPNVVGVDFSFNMIKLAKSRDVNGRYLVADVRALPFKNKVFSYSLSVAVLHHLHPNDSIRALLELKRVTRNECLLSVWSKEQERFKDSPSEVFIPFGKQERYYYLYTKAEFESLVKKIFIKIKEIPDRENIVLVGFNNLNY